MKKGDYGHRGHYDKTELPPAPGSPDARPRDPYKEDMYDKKPKYPTASKDPDFSKPKHDSAGVEKKPKLNEGKKSYSKDHPYNESRPKSLADIRKKLGRR